MILPKISELSDAVRQIEKAIVSLNLADDCRNAMIVWCTEGGVLAQDVIENGPIDAADQLLGSDSPDHGIWVWEGQADWAGDEFEQEIIFLTLEWRQPTEKEWAAIKDQINPFEKLINTLI